MIPEIAEYLKQANPDFNSGFRLFCRYSLNQSLMSWIGRKKDEQMLRYELQKLDKAPRVHVNPEAELHETRFNRFLDAPAAAAAPAPDPASAPEAPKITFRTYDERRTVRASLPPEMQAIYDRTIEEYRVRRGYHEKMKAARTDQDRATFRAGILSCQERIADGWKQIDDFQLQREIDAQQITFNEKNCRAYISKALAADTVSDKVRKGVRARVTALLDHGCTISPQTQQQLKARGLI